LGTKRTEDFEPYWQDEKDWLCIIEFLPTDNPEARLFAADIIGYLVGLCKSSDTSSGYANLTNTRSLALLGEPDASAYELLFSFSSPEGKNEFLNLVRSNEDMGTDYIIELTPPTTEEIRNARPLATGPTPDALTRSALFSFVKALSSHSPLAHASNIDVHKVGAAIIPHSSAMQTQGCVTQLRRRNSMQAYVDRFGLHVQAVLRHAGVRVARAQEFVAPGRTVAANHVDFTTGIAERRGQVVEQVEKARIEMTHISGTVVAQIMIEFF
jgi:hypothetical protein